MGKIVSISGGVISVAIGVVLLFKWIAVVVSGLKFCVVMALLFGGLMAILFGIIEMKDSMELKKMEKEEQGKKE